MAIEQEVRLSMKYNGIAPIVHAVQYETGRDLKMILTDVTLASGNTATLMFKRSDGSFNTVNCTLILADNAFTADITQALTQPGPTDCQLKVTASNKVVSSYTFVIVVQKTTEGRAPIDQEGYTVDDIQAFLDAIHDQAANLYDNVVHDFTNDDVIYTTIISSNKWHILSGTGGNGATVFQIPGNAASVRIKANAGSTVYAFLRTFEEPEEGVTPDFSVSYPGRIAVDSGSDVTYTIERDMKYLYILRYNSSHVDNTAKVTFYSLKVDPTLRTPGVPAEAKATGDNIDRIDGVLEDELPIRPYITSFDGNTALGNQSINTICRLIAISGLTDLPDGVDITNHVAWMYTFGSNINRHQVLWVPYKQGFYQRLYRNSSWSDWESILSDALDALDAKFETRINATSFDGGTVLGNQPVNTICRIAGVNGLTDAPPNVDLATGGYVAWMWTYGSSTNKHQVMFYPHNNDIYQRMYRRDSWTAWVGTRGGSGGGGGGDASESIKILCIGNSFNQDVFAYVPPILQEILPNCEITIGVLYTGSASYENHIQKYTRYIYRDQDDNELQVAEAYTKWNLWTPDSLRWTRESNNTTLKDALALTDWDIVVMQPTSSDIVNYIDSGTETGVITNARTLMRIVQENAIKPVQFATFAFVGRRSPYAEDTPPTGNHAHSAEEMTTMIMQATEAIVKEVGFMDYFPVANAIGSARTNATFAALGDERGYTDPVSGDRVDKGKLMFNNHLQNGLGDLISSYVITLKILEWMGHKEKGVYSSTFMPTDTNIAAIGAMSNNGDMCHGSSVGITADNVKAAQEIATFAVHNPTEILTCTNIIVTPPAQNPVLSS